MSKIAIITGSIYTMGGEQRVVCVMANEFVKRHDVTIFTMDSPKNRNNLFHLSPKVKVRDYFPYKGDVISFLLRVATHLTPFLVYDMFPSLLERAYCSASYAKKMNELLAEDFDVVIATSWMLTITLGKVCKLYPHRFKAIGWEHSSFEAYFKEKYMHLYHHEKVFSENAKYLDHVIVLNENYAKKYKEFLNITCNVVYNPKSFSSQKKSGLNEKHFISLGRLIHIKGFDLLIEAFALFAKEDAEWDLLIAGEGKLKKKLQKRVEELCLNERVKFLGHRNDVQNLLYDSSIYLLPSRFEGFPMCVAEAYEMGLPVIAFDIPAMGPLKGDGAAKIVECFDIKQFAKAMKEMAHSYEKRRCMGQKAETLAQGLSPESIAKCWDVYLETM